MSNKPDLTKFSKTLFWDTTIDRIDFVTHKCYVINRVFERGNKEEIMEIIRFYGRDTILNNLFYLLLSATLKYSIDNIATMRCEINTVKCRIPK